jgi:PKD repeat protein
VSFNAQLSFPYSGIKYRFAFGDGSQTDWLDSPRTSHLYRSPGTYLAYVDLGLKNGGRTKQVGGSLRQPIVVNQPKRPDDPVIDPKDPRDPKDPIKPDRLPGPVRLTAGPTPVQQGKTVSFDARAEATNSNVRYRFVFGDGSSGDWQTSDKVTHEYSSRGNYSASVTLGLIRNGRIRPLSSDTQRIQVTSSVPATAAELRVNPTSVSLGQSVGFIAHVTPVESDLRYRFIFGDGSSQTEWQTASETSYAYKAAGDYTAQVEIGRWTNGSVTRLATSNSRLVSVTGGSVSSVSPSPSPSGGGGSSGNGGSTTSSPGQGDGDGPGSGLPNNWWLYLLLALLLTFVAYQTYRSLLAPRTTFHATRDPGDAEVDSAAKGLEISSQVLLRPNVSDAQYLVYSDDAIVRSVRRENV